MKCIKLGLIIFFLGILLSACVYDRGLVLFNTEPITKQNVLNDEKIFKSGNKIYYLFLAPEKMKNEFIRVQIFKMTDKAPWGGNEVVRTKDFRLMKDEKYYHTDYFVLHEKGRYVLQVFSHDDFQHPLALNDFYVQ
jgi:hypothetical protein